MGAISLVLHAHLPAIGGTSAEVWFHEAMLGSYIPLTKMLEEVEGPGRLTLTASPPLLEMMCDRAVLERFDEYLRAHHEHAEHFARSGPEDTRAGAAELARRSDRAASYFRQIDRDLPARWKALRDDGRIELGACAGTHAILPLLKTDDFRQRHIRMGIEVFEEVFGFSPKFMWLPECGFTEGIDRLLAGEGIWASVVEARGFGEAVPTPIRGKYAPIISDNVAFFARDPDSGARVWSRQTGYPGAPEYREFHREAVARTEDSPGAGRGVKLWRVTGSEVSLGEKAAWSPEVAYEKARAHGRDFVETVAADLQQAATNIEGTPHLCCPFDAELFGHWWYEGPEFLRSVVEHAAESDVDLITPSDYLAAGPSLQLATPAPSTWGVGGDFSWWVDESTVWMIPLLHTAEERWLDAREHYGSTDALSMAATELMFAQASDWPFAIRGVTHAEFARRQVTERLIQFDRLLRGDPELL